MIRKVYNKWIKTKILLKSPSLSHFVPVTRLLRPQTLRSMLETYKMVYIKPVYGMKGIGVIRIEWNESDTALPFKYQYETTIKQFKEFSQMYQDLKPIISGKKYMIQQGIRLLKYNSRIFDIRVLTQRIPPYNWKVTGIIGRVAVHNKIVTNVHRGGELKEFDELLSSFMSDSKRIRFQQLLKILSLKAARSMSRRYPGVGELGIDIAVDEQFKPWILEINTAPDLTIFRHIQDKSVMDQIARYARQYRRSRR